MTELEKSMESLITVFHRYAKEGGNKTTLSKKELKKLIENELPNFLTVRLFCFSWGLGSVNMMNQWMHVTSCFSAWLCFRPRKTPTQCHASSRIWTRTRTMSWTLRNLFPSSLDWQSPVKSITLCTTKRRARSEGLTKDQWLLKTKSIFLSCMTH